MQRWWQIENPGGGITQTDLQFNYQQSDITNGTETNYRAYRIAGGAATQIPGSVDATANFVIALNVTQFSDWTLADPAAPTAAGVQISGRVLSADGRAVRGAFVYLVDASGNYRQAQSNTFGYYRFTDVPAGATYLMSVKSKQYKFAARVVNVGEDITEMDFIALP